MFEPKREEVTGDWRKLHNKKHDKWCSSSNVIMMATSRRKR
jgi:hypothetical protein